MTDPEDVPIHTLTGAYAVAALPEEERLRFEAHLLDCGSCVQEVRELHAAAARLGAAVAEPAPVGLKARVLAQIATVRQLPPLTRVGRHTRPSRTSGWRAPLSIAAAALLATSVGLGGLTLSQQRRIDELSAATQRVDRVVEDPSRVTRSASAVGGGMGTVVAAGGQALFVGAGLPAPASGRTYQLWVIRDSEPPRSAGVLAADNGSVATLVKDVRPADVVGLTVEPASGSTAPTTRPLLLLRV